MQILNFIRRRNLTKTIKLKNKNIQKSSISRGNVHMHCFNQNYYLCRKNHIMI